MTKVRTSWGIGLAERGHAEYVPTADLVTVAMLIGDELDADRYLATDPEIAAAPPTRWLTDDAGRAPLATVSISATDWSSVRDQWDRMFMV